MAQISKGDTFTDGQQVTGSRLNQLVDSSILLVGAITDQNSLTAATVASDDQMILSDTSDAVLKKTTVGDILGSSLPIVASAITGTAVTGTSVTTPVINASANSDVIVTTFDGANVTGKPFNSPDGIVTTVSSVAHGLPTGALVQITASNTAYSGLYKIVAINANEFTYSVFPTTVLASGTCSYIRKGTERINGNQTVSGSVVVAGNNTTEGNSRIVGNLNVGGTITNAGLQPIVRVANISLSLASGTQYTYPTIGSWANVPLNTLSQTDNFVVNSASFTGSGTTNSDITLPAGTYVMQVVAMIQSQGGEGGIIPRVRNATSSTVIGTGYIAYCSGGANSSSVYQVAFKLTVQSTINFQVWVPVTGSPTYATSQIGLTGATENLFPVTITKLA